MRKIIINPDTFIKRGDLPQRIIGPHKEEAEPKPELPDFSEMEIDAAGYLVRRRMPLLPAGDSEGE